MSEPGADEPQLFGATRRRDRWWLKILVGFVTAALLYTAYGFGLVWLDAKRRWPGDTAGWVGWVLAAFWFAILSSMAFVWLRDRRLPEIFNRPEYLCSRCSGAFIGRHVRVVPAFEPSMDDYLLTFRCDDCWPVTLRETEMRFLANVEWARERLKFVRCFERTGLRGLDPSDETRFRGQVVRLLKAFRTRKLDIPLL